MGGYFNTFKEQGVTALLIREVREIVRTQLGGGRRSGAGEAAVVLKSSHAFKLW